MIKFFRKIRQHLLTEKRFNKYLLYAIGEILLVVIGILIALQINTWNTNRLQGIKEINYLNEIKDNLGEDLKNIDDALKFNNEKKDTIIAVFKMFSVEADPVSYMPRFYMQMKTLSEFTSFSPKRIAFNNMTSSENIDLITNNGLRKELSTYYSFNYNDGTQERVKEVNRKFIDDIAPMLFSRELLKMAVNVDSHVQKINQVFIHKSELVNSNLFTMLKTIDAHNNLLNETKNNVEQLIKSITKAL